MTNIGIIGNPSYSAWAGHAGSAQGEIAPVGSGSVASDFWKFNPSYGDTICYRMGVNALPKAVAQGPFYIDVYTADCVKLLQSHFGPIPMQGGMITSVTVGAQ